jgi:hypothetical protein
MDGMVKASSRGKRALSIFAREHDTGGRLGRTASHARSISIRGFPNLGGRENEGTLARSMAIEEVRNTLAIEECSEKRFRD